MDGHGLIRQHGLSRFKQQLEQWKPRPNSGSLLKDIVFLLLVVFLQSTLLPDILGPFGYLDLLTPWLVITCVRQGPFQATLLAMIGSFALETKLAVPAGIYLCCYWIVASLIFQFRSALSWRYKTPWLVCYALAGLWVILFETFVASFLHEQWKLEFGFLFQQVVRLIIAVSFGMMLSREWMRIDAEEPVPQ